MKTWEVISNTGKKEIITAEQMECHTFNSGRRLLLFTTAKKVIGFFYKPQSLKAIQEEPDFVDDLMNIAEEFMDDTRKSQGGIG